LLFERSMLGSDVEVGMAANSDRELPQQHRTPSPSPNSTGGLMPVGETTSSGGGGGFGATWVVNAAVPPGLPDVKEPDARPVWGEPRGFLPDPIPEGRFRPPRVPMLQERSLIRKSV
jgi:hypothetical protein